MKNNQMQPPISRLLRHAGDTLDEFFSCPNDHKATLVVPIHRGQRTKCALVFFRLYADLNKSHFKKELLQLDKGKAQNLHLFMNFKLGPKIA